MSKELKEGSIFGRYIKSLPVHEQEELNKTLKLMEDNTFFEMNIISEFQDKDGKVKSTATRTVKVYKRINRDLTVDDRLLISFGGYAEYALDKHYIETTRERLLTFDDSTFRIDMGRNENIPRKIMLPLLEEIEQTLYQKGIEIEEDYSKDFRESEMGKMIASLGMMI